MLLDIRLAPMAGVTNAPLRLVARECGAELVTSEEMDALALLEGSAKTRALAPHLPEEWPLAMQILGGDPGVLAEAPRRLEGDGADGIDLDLGCPVPKIVAKGQGGGAHARPTPRRRDLSDRTQGAPRASDDQDPRRLGRPPRQRGGDRADCGGEAFLSNAILTQFGE